MSDSPIIVVWTLRIEVAFYAALPLLAWALGRLGLRGRLRGLGWLVAASLGVTALTWSLALTAGTTPSVPIDFVPWLWAFVPGMLVAELELGRPAVLSAIGWRGAALGVGLVALGSISNPFPNIAAVVGSGLLVGSVVSAPPLTGAAARLALAGGAVSYSVYLWHEAIITLVDRPASWGGAALAFAVTLVIAGAVYLVVEAPAMRMGRTLIAVHAVRARRNEAASTIGRVR